MIRAINITISISKWDQNDFREWLTFDIKNMSFSFHRYCSAPKAAPQNKFRIGHQINHVMCVTYSFIYWYSYSWKKNKLNLAFQSSTEKKTSNKIEWVRFYYCHIFFPNYLRYSTAHAGWEAYKRSVYTRNYTTK